jgi:hypothetical protein
MHEKVPREGKQSNTSLSPYLSCVFACVNVRAGVNWGADVSSCASSDLPMPRTEPGETFYFWLSRLCLAWSLARNT